MAGDRSAKTNGGVNERSRERLLRGPLSLGMVRFGLPLAIGMVLHTAFNLVDMFMISRLEEATDALAALGVCDMWAAAATILSTGLGTAAATRISHGLGASDLRAVRRATWQSLWLVGWLSLFFGAFGIFGADWLIRDVMQLKGRAATIGSGYLQVMLGGSATIFLLLQLTAILRALGHAKRAAALLIGGNALNILLNVLFIYGAGPVPDAFAFLAPYTVPLAESWGVPRLGVLGAAYATLIARAVPVVLGVVLLLRRQGGPRFHMAYLRPMGAEIRALVRLAWPQSAQLVLRALGTLFVLGLVGAAYTTDADATTLGALGICLRLETMVLFVGMGWGAAASSFVAANLGAGQRRRAARAGWAAALFDGVMMVGLAWAFLRFGGPFIAFFDDSVAVVAAGETYLRVLAPSYVLLGMAVVLSQAMAGAGATALSLRVDAAVLLPAMAVFYGLVVFYGAMADMLWQAMAIANGVGSLAFGGVYAWGRFFRGKAALSTNGAAARSGSNGVSNRPSLADSTVAPTPSSSPDSKGALSSGPGDPSGDVAAGEGA